MTEKIRVQMTPDNYPQKVRVSQYDIGRVIKFILFDGDEPYAIPADATVKFQGTKKSGLGFNLTGTIVNSCTVQFVSNEQMTQEFGNYPAEIVITSTAAGSVIGTANVLLCVEKSPHPTGTTDGTREELISEITVLVERAETAAEYAVAAKDEAEQYVDEIKELSATAEQLSPDAGAYAHYDSSEGLLTIGIPAGQTGPAGPAGPTGAAGSDGFSPVITSQRSGSVVNISITDATHTEVTTIADGEDGQDGTDGTTFTPSVSSEGVISWTNDGGKQNPQSVNIKGPAGPTGPQGPAYVLTEADKASIVTDVLAEMIDAETEGM